MHLFVLETGPRPNSSACVNEASGLCNASFTRWAALFAVTVGVAMTAVRGAV